MRFRFERTSPEGLPVVPVIPDFRLSTIEGRNGIGKTLAARILEFITGQQPFAALPKAWESFGEDLGSLTVTIDGFPTEEVVRCELDSSDWVGRTESECAASPGRVFINEGATSWEALRHLIQVRRIAGDEGLSETLARTLREDSLYARARGTTAAATVDTFGAHLGALTDNLVAVQANGYSNAIAHCRDVSRQFEAAQSRADTAARTHEGIAATLARYESLAQSLDVLPGLLGEYAAILRDHARAATSVDEADRSLTDVGRRQAETAGTEAQIDKLVNLLPRRRGHLANARFEEQRIHALLGLERRLSPAEIRARTRDTRSEVSRLKEENRSGNLAGTIREAQAAIEDELHAMPDAARHEVIATVGRDIRGHELAKGIAVRRKQLEGQPKPDEVAERERTIIKLETQLVRLEILDAIYRKTDQKQKLVDDGIRDLIKLRGATDGDKALVDANERATLARTDLVTATLAIRNCQAAIDAATDHDVTTEVAPKVSSDADDETSDAENDFAAPPTAADVAGQVAQWLSRAEGDLEKRFRRSWAEASSESDSLIASISNRRPVMATIIETLSREAETAESERSSTASAMAEVSEATERARDDVRGWLDRIHGALRSLHDESGPWGIYQLAVASILSKFELDMTVVGELIENEVALDEVLAEGNSRGAATVAATKAVEVVMAIAEEVEACAARVRDQWSNTANYLHQFSGELSPRLDDRSFDAKSLRARAGSLVTKWAETTIGELLSSPELRAELFDSSDSVSFNMGDLTVSWTEPSTGRKHRRPIEAFSSGEQVFAYTKAKLELLRDLHTKANYVVVFLDEFGAFVARDRFAQLVTYIEHDALGAIADQIIVTVPLSADLEQVRDRAALASVKAELFDPPGYVVIPARNE